MTVRTIIGDCRDVLRTLPDASVNCCVTSPPYFGLRDYGVAGQIGLEKTPDAYVAELVAVFREVRRVLKDNSTVWLNLGDSYCSIGHKKSSSGYGTTGLAGGKAQEHSPLRRENNVPGLKHKDLIGIPWRVAFALQADGWWFRQDIIWSKPNPMPESVTDRCTKAHEYIFMLSKSARYYYDGDAVREPVDLEYLKARWGGSLERTGENGLDTPTRSVGNGKAQALGVNPDGRNKRSVWTVATHPYAQAHFATFPPALIEPCIKAGCPMHLCAKCGAPWVRDVEIGEPSKETTRGRQQWTAVTGQRDSAGGLPHRERRTRGFIPSCECDWEYTTNRGTVLDPFGGAGTTGLVADRLGRNAILIELNADYAEMARRRIHDDAPLFAARPANENDDIGEVKFDG